MLIALLVYLIDRPRRLVACLLLSYLALLLGGVCLGFPQFSADRPWQLLGTLAWLEGFGAVLAAALDDLGHFDIARVLSQAEPPQFFQYVFYLAGIAIILNNPSYAWASCAVTLVSLAVAPLLARLRRPTAPPEEK